MLLPSLVKGNFPWRNVLQGSPHLSPGTATGGGQAGEVCSGISCSMGLSACSVSAEVELTGYLDFAT